MTDEQANKIIELLILIHSRLIYIDEGQDYNADLLKVIIDQQH